MSHDSKNISHRLLTTLEQMQEVASELDSFLQHQKDCHFFLKPDWVLPWISIFMDSRSKVWAHIFEIDGQLVGYAPFYLKYIGRFQGYALHILGDGEDEAMEVSSEYPDVAILEPYKTEVFAKLTDELERLDNVTSIVFKRLLARSDILYWTSLLPRKWYTSIESIGFRFVLDVFQSESNQVDSLPSAQLRRQFRKWRNSSDRVKVRIANDISSAESEFLFLKELHSNSWNARGKRGAFSSREFSDFHQKFISQISKTREVCLFSIMVNESLVASFYGWFYGSTLFYYQSGIIRRAGGGKFRKPSSLKSH
ncbi:GNAT family N-acetyltransferase [Alteromonas flava]|uniref:GNAT family N-acetyltransferase n=1 Tax=Alteromonas flava TaxID=2048003 RepID=UPI000C28E161|nr:GNAT family N-acetyltransferase [Alteromonas flava]